MVRIIIDKREIRSSIVKLLEQKGIDISLELMEVGDYILSDRVKVERKTVDDFYKSLFEDRKLFGQLYDLAHTSELPLLIIEGYEAELFTARRIDPKAVEGILNSIALMRIPIRYTVNAQGTASVLASIATKEQSENKREVSYHGKRSHLNTAEKQLYIITSITDIGPATAKSLLKHFGTVENVMKAGIGELMEVDGVGMVTASAIRNIVTERFDYE